MVGMVEMVEMVETGGTAGMEGMAGMGATRGNLAMVAPSTIVAMMVEAFAARWLSLPAAQSMQRQRKRKLLL